MRSIGDSAPTRREPEPRPARAAVTSISSLLSGRSAPRSDRAFRRGSGGATRDAALYREIAPQNITFDGSHKIYRIGPTFSPLFEHAPQRVLSALALGFGDGVNGATQPLLLCESPTALSRPKMDVLAPVCRAIRAKRPVAIRYHSMSSGESERVIVPFALVDTGLRWHVRAFDRKSGEFRDFVVTRIEAPILLDEEPQANERPDNDIQWTRIVELDFVPHPRLERPEIIRMDYGMQDGAIRIRVRAAVAGSMLLRWSVDCSPDHRLKEEQYRCGSAIRWRCTASGKLALYQRRWRNDRKERTRWPRHLKPTTT